MSERSKCVIDRNTWYRGHGSLDSRLLRYDGQKCCVGFYAEQVLKAPPERILDISVLARAGYGDPIMGTLIVTNIYVVNDAPYLSAAHRERTLIDEFARVLNCDLSFTGEALT